jgi:hypothetical protein
MIRQLVVAAAMTAAAVGTAAVAGAEPRHYDTDVPGMVYDAINGYACDNYERFTFGRGPGGEALACHFIPNQFPDPTRGTPASGGYWVISYPLRGVQEIGSPCPNSQSAAQSPDGLPLLCVGAQGWQPGIFTGGAGPYAPPGIVPYPVEEPPPSQVPIPGHL